MVKDASGRSRGLVLRLPTRLCSDEFSPSFFSRLRADLCVLVCDGSYSELRVDLSSVVTADSVALRRLRALTEVLGDLVEVRIARDTAPAPMSSRPTEWSGVSERRSAEWSAASNAASNAVEGQVSSWRGREASFHVSHVPDSPARRRMVEVDAPSGRQGADASFSISFENPTSLPTATVSSSEPAVVTETYPNLSIRPVGTWLQLTSGEVGLALVTRARERTDLEDTFEMTSEDTSRATGVAEVRELELFV